MKNLVIMKTELIKTYDGYKAVSLLSRNNNYLDVTTIKRGDGKYATIVSKVQLRKLNEISVREIEESALLAQHNVANATTKQVASLHKTALSMINKLL